MVAARQNEDFLLKATHFSSIECHLRISVRKGSEPMFVLMSGFRENHDCITVEKGFFGITESSSVVFQCLFTFPVQSESRQQADGTKEFVCDWTQGEDICPDYQVHQSVSYGQQYPQSIIQRILVI